MNNVLFRFTAYLQVELVMASTSHTSFARMMVSPKSTYPKTVCNNIPIAPKMLIRHYKHDKHDKPASKHHAFIA